MVDDTRSVFIGMASTWRDGLGVSKIGVLD